jgi:hypothetical protein
MLFAAISVLAIRAHWDKKKYVWFWATIAILIILHTVLIGSLNWSQRSYPGYTLLLFGVLDFATVYGCIKLVASIMGVATRHDVEPRQG